MANESFRLSLPFPALSRDTLLFYFQNRTAMLFTSEKKKQNLKHKEKKKSDMTSTANTVNKLL